MHLTNHPPSMTIRTDIFLKCIPVLQLIFQSFLHPVYSVPHNIIYLGAKQLVISSRKISLDCLNVLKKNTTLSNYGSSDRLCQHAEMKVKKIHAIKV